MPADSVPELLKRIKASGVIPAERASELDELPHSSMSAVTDLTADLRERKLLTDYQIELLLGDEPAIDR